MAMNVKARDRVFQIVSNIPKGKVMSYGTIAKLANLKSPRTVGMYIHTNTDPTNVPCHRVVFADGSLSPGYAMGGLRKQREMLTQEGVFFDRGKVMRVSFVK